MLTPGYFLLKTKMVMATVPAITRPTIAKITLPTKATRAAAVISVLQDADFGGVRGTVGSVCWKIRRTRIFSGSHDQMERAGPTRQALTILIEFATRCGLFGANPPGGDLSLEIIFAFRSEER